MAVRFNISASFVRKLRQREFTTSSVVALAYSGPTPLLLRKTQSSASGMSASATPDVTFDELCI
ncbi:hypothetical protein [Hymenobacter elongatus]|uniref:Uncharacterized protein n=1 Tax=Hymenobacter elongatus TaxID=877208 RepID=A0A4Z0PDN3_9BACT|nr:hypothetical protein [Hymenobacter elongatus]TGE11286.1 hypothetical protein E5J99_20990 [Hymenobacter elongatus]